MSMVRELYIISGAAGLGFTIATGININLTNYVDQEIQQMSVNNSRLTQIPSFWASYGDIQLKQADIKYFEKNNQLCVVIEEKEYCFDSPKN